MQNTLHRIDHIPVVMPERLILSRMGCHRHLNVMNDVQKGKIDTLMREAFSLCHPRGIWRLRSIVRNEPDMVELEGASVFHSTALAALLNGCDSVWIGAASAGRNIAEHIGKKCDGDEILAAVVYDAVGSETTDAAMDWLQSFAARELLRQGMRLAPRRFSPGYSDLDLSAQRTIFTLLDLESWGLQLTESMLIVPEKSVTAIAGVNMRTNNH